MSIIDFFLHSSGKKSRKSSKNNIEWIVNKKVLIEWSKNVRRSEEWWGLYSVKCEEYVYTHIHFRKMIRIGQYCFYIQIHIIFIQEYSERVSFSRCALTRMSTKFSIYLTKNHHDEIFFLHQWVFRINFRYTYTL